MPCVPHTDRRGRCPALPLQHRHEYAAVLPRGLPADVFTDLDVVEQRLTRFETRCNAAAKPFKWKFTTTDLADLLDRLDRQHQAQSPTPPNPRPPDLQTNLQT